MNLDEEFTFKDDPSFADFKTQNFYLAVYLKAFGFPLLRVEKVSLTRVVFVFPKSPNLEEEMSKFLYGRALIDPQKFIVEIKALKSIIFESLDNQN